jgi:hypothetical protein
MGSDGALAAGLILLGLLVVLGGLILMIWAVVDAARRQFENDTVKVVWILVIVLGGPVGAVVYLVAGRPMGELPY